MTNTIMVLGGGIIGAAAAYTLAKRGERVLLVDQFAPGHERGSSHGDGRILRFNYPEAIYLAMAKQVYPMWDTLSEQAGKPLTAKTGLWEVAPAGSGFLAETEANLQAGGIPIERLTPAESRQRFPLLHIDDHSEAIYQPDGAVMFADRAVQTYWDLAEAHGANTRTNTRITALDVTKRVVTLHTEHGEMLTGSRLLIAAGGWLNKLLAPLGVTLPLTVTQEQVGFFASKDPARYRHTAGAFPVVLDYHSDPIHYSLPQIDVPGLKAGWHHAGAEIDADAPQPLSTAITSGIEKWVGERFPYLEPIPFKTLSCLYVDTPDLHFIIDRLPTIPEIVVAAGFSGHGFKFAPILGEGLADLLTDREPALDLSLFALGRFATPDQLQRRTGA